MAVDDEFEPKLGRIRSQGAGRSRKYLHRVLRAASLAGMPPKDGRSKFHGSQIGRGASLGRLLSSRDGYAAFRSRRVIVKGRTVKLAGNGVKAARAHLRYVQRDGVTRATVTSNKVALWDLRTGELVREEGLPRKASGQDVALVGEEEIACLSWDQNVRLRDPKTWKVRATLEALMLAYPAHPVTDGLPKNRAALGFDTRFRLPV